MRLYPINRKQLFRERNNLREKFLQAYQLLDTNEKSAVKALKKLGFKVECWELLEDKWVLN